jgi:hypothetical protein
MKFLPRPSTPRNALSDMIEFVRERRQHQYVFAALAIAIPTLTLYAIANEFDRKPEWKPPTVTYMTQWRASRTPAQVRAQQAIDLPAELARKKAARDAEAARKAQFVRLKTKLKAVGF